MEYVYKYTDVNDGIVKYIGRTKNLAKRIAAHEAEERFKGINWDIEYIKLETRSESEALEQHFIAHYHTDNYMNISKAGWGLIGFAPDVEWKKYVDTTVRLKAANKSLANENRELMAKVDELTKKNIELEERLSELNDLIFNSCERNKTEMNHYREVLARNMHLENECLDLKLQVYELYQQIGKQYEETPSYLTEATKRISDANFERMKLM